MSKDVFVPFGGDRKCSSRYRRDWGNAKEKHCSAFSSTPKLCEISSHFFLLKAVAVFDFGFDRSVEEPKEYTALGLESCWASLINELTTINHALGD
jgi:hypothetical protein